MKHYTTEGIEFESSEKPQVDWENVVNAIRAQIKEYGPISFREFNEIYNEHTPKPETLEDVVREFCVEADYLFYDSGKRSARMFHKMRELTKETK